jgi:CBS domain containing-hemolysin-like protein
MTLFVTGVLIALVVSSLCSLMEATLLSLTPAQVASISERRPRIGRIWAGFKNEIERPIAVILLLNTAAHTVGASIAGAQFGKVFGEEHLWLFAAIFTFLMLQFTEILAKSLGVRFNRSLSLVIARPLQLMATILRPLLAIVHFINRPFEGRRRAEEPSATIEEIAALAGLARLSREISPHQERIIATAPRLSEFRVGDIQIPVRDVAFLDASQTLQDGVEHVRRFLYTRFPVCEAGDRDRVIGYVNAKEMLLLATDPSSAAEQRLPIRPILGVSEEDSAAAALDTFISERAHVAVVRNEGGATTGLVTLEDLVEELVGDIRDEFDRLPRYVHRTGDDRWKVGGGVRMQSLAAALQLDLTQGPRAADQALAAWLEGRIEGPMQLGSTVDAHGFRFIVRRLRRGSLYECEIRRLASTGSAT